MISQRDSLTGREVAGHRLVRVLGAGGAGVVYLGEDLSNPSCMRAIKLLIPHAQYSPTQSAALQERFLREAQAAAQLQHPNILPVLSSGFDAGFAYMVMPYIPGGTLESRLSAGRELPLSQVSSYLTQIASALDFAHDHGVVHRDVKPNNVLVQDDTVYVTDFGIARICESEDGPFTTAPATLTVSGQVLGTPRYMAPEQLNTHDVGPAADIYALGVTLYELVTGRVPFDAPTPFGIIMKHVQEQPMAPIMSRPDLPEPAQAAILRALAKQPVDRFATAGSLARAFAAGLEGQWTDGLAPSEHGVPATLLASGYTPTQLASSAPFTPTPGHNPTAGKWPSYPTSPAPYAMPGLSITLPLSAKTLIVAAALVALVIGCASSLYFAHAASQLAASQGASGQAANSGASSAPTTTRHTPTAASPTTVPAQVPSRSAPPASSSYVPVPVSRTLYQTSAPGNCDAQGGAWSQNSSGMQSCSGGSLVLAVRGCTCPISVVDLISMPGVAYPSSYVAQVSATPLSGDPRVRFGFKFRQQSVEDTGNGRGGYSFLINTQGAWEFMRYSSDGTASRLDQSALGQSLTGPITLTLVVRGNTYSFYVNGGLVTTESDTTYTSGYFAVTVSPGRTVEFHNLSVYAPK